MSKSAKFDTVKQAIKIITGHANIIGTPAVFFKMTGNHVAAILLTQLLYWSDRSSNNDGWIYKTAQEWQEELTMSRYQVNHAVEDLRKWGVETKLKKANGAPTTHYRVNFEVFLPMLKAFLNEQSCQKIQAQPQSDFQVSRKSDFEETLKTMDFEETSNSYNSRLHAETKTKTILCIAENPQARVDDFLQEPQPQPLPEQPTHQRQPKNEQSPEQLAAHQEYLARKREIESIWVECIGVKPVHFGEIAKSSKALAEAGYTAEQVRDCFTHMLERKFWRDKFNAGEPIKLASVANELPTWLQVNEKELARKQAEQQRIEQERARRAQQNAPMSPEARAAAARTAQEMRQRMQQAVV